MRKSRSGRTFSRKGVKQKHVVGCLMRSVGYGSRIVMVLGRTKVKMPEGGVREYLRELFEFYEGQRVAYEKRCDTEWSPDIEREMNRYGSEARALKYAIELIQGSPVGGGDPLTSDSEDAARYRWLKAEDRRVTPLGTISWRMQGNSTPCKLADVDNLDALIDAAIDNPGAGVREIYLIATAPSGVLQTEQRLTPEAAKRLQEDWKTLSGGGDANGR